MPDPLKGCMLSFLPEAAEYPLTRIDLTKSQKILEAYYWS